MIYAFDVHYWEDKAKTVAISFEDWRASVPNIVYEEVLPIASEYIPGEFYKRELPCIVSLLDKIPLKQGDIIVIDGFVFLDDHDKLGLGGHLYETLNRNYAIVGVAKTNFASLHKNRINILRGDSKKPLYISALGIELEFVAEKIKIMHGEYRFPTLLKLLDSITKNH